MAKHRLHRVAGLGPTYESARGGDKSAIKYITMIEGIWSKGHESHMKTNLTKNNK